MKNGASFTAVTLTLIVLAAWRRVLAAVGRAAAVLHVEAEVGQTVAVGVGRRRVRQQVAADRIGRDDRARGDRHAAHRQGAHRRRDYDDHVEQGVGRHVERIGEAEVGRTNE